jgi:glycolate dehydrogenase FAD-binding subunit
MKISPVTLVANLAREISSSAVTVDVCDLAGHEVDGKAPTAVCRPATVEEAAAVLRVCSEADASVVPWGGGSFMQLGNVPRRFDVVLALDKLSRLIEHDDANLTATVETGMSVAAFQRALAERRQFLPIDSGKPQQATLGGLAAANINGPRRALYGGVRDLVTGIKVVLADGTRIKSGGKVVKNVAGYDLAKLFIGSLGTLGVITELTFRVSPQHEGAATFVATGALEGCLGFIKEVSVSPLLPSAVAVAGAGENPRACRTAIWVEGFEEAIARHFRDLGAMAQRAGLQSDAALRSEAHDRLWEELDPFGWNGGGLLCRVVVPVGRLEKPLAMLRGMSETGECLRYAAHAGGTVWSLLNGEAAALQAYARLAAAARDSSGHAIIAAAPPALKADIDVWGEPPPTLALMREIKRQFDPQTILNPGRFIAHI